MAIRPKESVLNDNQIESLGIQKLIFHVINVDGEGEDRVIPLDEVALDDDQKKFFLDRIRSVAKGVQYDFIPNNVTTKNSCNTLLTEPENFRKTSIELTHAFASHHKGNMSSGVFVTSIVQTVFTAGRPIQMIFLAKFDHRNVYQIVVRAKQNGDGNEVVMQKIADNLVEDKSAIQKSALIDISESFSWDVLADERKLKSSGEVTDYFKGFLGAQLKEVASVLTVRAVQSVRKWAYALEEENLPDGEERGNYRARAVSYMQTQDEFDSDGFIEAVVKDTDPVRREAVKASLKATLEEAGLTNQKFQPKPASLPRTDKKQVWKTAEGLTLEFSGESTDFGLKVEERNDGQDGYLISIKTKSYESV